jgi:hypothetical protein
MQVNAALRTSQVLRGAAAVSRHALPRSAGLASFGARRTQSVVAGSTAAVGVGRPSFGGQRTASAGSRSGALRASGASALALSAKVAPAVCPAWSAQAPRSTVRCSSSAALFASLGHSRAQRVLLSLASCKASSRCSVGAGKLTVVNGSQFSGCGSANAAPNPVFKRTSHGVPWAAA